MTTLAHISDVHLGPLPKVRPRDLLSKRITGYINWQLSRIRKMRSDSMSALLDHMKAQDADQIAVTGDLVNLALDEEIDRAGAWLATLGPPDKVCVVPGNHDAYVRGTLARALEAYGPYMSGETLDEHPFPYVRRLGEIAIIGCSSAIVTPPFFAAGQVSNAQAGRLGRILDVLGEAGYFRIVLIHHPPTPEFAASRRLGLWKADIFREVVAASGAEMILHGHTHESSIGAIAGKGADVPVIGVAAASAAPGGHDSPGRYNLFRIDKVGSDWSCTMREYGYQRVGDDIALRLQLRIY